MQEKKIPNIDEAMTFLLEFADYEKITNYKYNIATFNLDRVEALMAAVGDPHRAFRSVHIAGTKGKGSTAMMVRSILTAAGLRVGCFTSPHLVRLEERMTIDGELMPESELVALVNRLVPYTLKARLERPAESPTFFELVTAIGFMHFAQQAVDFAVVEVGMGGRLDATNVIAPEVAAITRIDFDHVRRLGKTLAKIAFEKGGIIKQDVPVVLAEQEPEALGALVAIAHRRGAPMVRVGRDVTLDVVKTGVADDGPYCRFGLRTRTRHYEALELRLLGRHQAANAATAVAVVEALSERCGLSIKEPAIRKGLVSARCPGRIEFFPGRPAVLLDGAHNPISIKVLCDILAATFRDRRVVLVMAVARDKDVDEMLKRILPRATHVIFTRSDSPRSEPPEELRKKALHLTGTQADSEPDAERAFARAQELADTDGLVCVTGSLYLAGKLRPLLLGCLKSLS